MTECDRRHRLLERMSERERHRTTGVRSGWHQFGRWRRRRPFWGGTLLLVAAVLTGYLPWRYERLVVIAAGSFTGPALVIALCLAACGLVVLAAPSVAGLFGLLGMALSAVAIVGALGGFLVGTLLGGLGGLLCFAWTPPASEAAGDGEGGSA